MTTTTTTMLEGRDLEDVRQVAQRGLALHAYQAVDFEAERSISLDWVEQVQGMADALIDLGDPGSPTRQRCDITPEQRAALVGAVEWVESWHEAAIEDAERIDYDDATYSRAMTEWRRGELARARRALAALEAAS